MSLYTLEEPAGIEDSEAVAFKFTRVIPQGFNRFLITMLVITMIWLAFGSFMSMASYLNRSGMDSLRHNFLVVFAVASIMPLVGIGIWMIPHLYPREVSIVASLDDRRVRVVKMPPVGKRPAIKLIDLSRVYAVRLKRWQYKTRTGMVDDFLLIFFLKNRPAYTMHFQTDMLNVITGLERALRAMVPGDEMKNDDRLYKGILGRMVVIQFALVMMVVGINLVIYVIGGFSPFDHEEIFVVDPLYQSIPVLIAVVGAVYYLALRHRTPAMNILSMILLAASWLISAGFLLLAWSLRLAVLGMDASIVTTSSSLFWFQFHLGTISIFMNILSIFRPFEMVGNTA